MSRLSKRTSHDHDDHDKRRVGRPGSPSCAGVQSSGIVTQRNLKSGATWPALAGLVHCDKQASILNLKEHSLLLSSTTPAAAAPVVLQFQVQDILIFHWQVLG
jgi:hypothetical protein